MKKQADFLILRLLLSYYKIEPKCFLWLGVILAVAVISSVLILPGAVQAFDYVELLKSNEAAVVGISDYDHKRENTYRYYGQDISVFAKKDSTGGLEDSFFAVVLQELDGREYDEKSYVGQDAVAEGAFGRLERGEAALSESIAKEKNIKTGDSIYLSKGTVLTVKYLYKEYYSITKVDLFKRTGSILINAYDEVSDKEDAENFISFFDKDEKRFTYLETKREQILNGRGYSAVWIGLYLLLNALAIIVATALHNKDVIPKLETIRDLGAQNKAYVFGILLHFITFMLPYIVCSIVFGYVYKFEFIIFCAGCIAFLIIAVNSMVYLSKLGISKGGRTYGKRN